MSGWNRAGTTLQSGYQQPARSGTDWLGFDNGLRKAPSEIKPTGFDNTQSVPTDQPQQAANGLRNEWTPTLQKALPDLRVSLGLTRKFELGRMYLSNVTSLSYANTHEQYNIVRQRLKRAAARSFIIIMTCAA
ncbi:MAG: hypothetical protein WKG07_07910 [Hymenobacter sp.]